MATIQKISACLWFDSEAEAAARQYTAIFPDSRITAISHYGEAGQQIHGRPAGSVMVVSFELAGQSFMALNGGPLFRLSEAVSLVISCDSQDEIDHYWQALGAGGDPAAQQCGWLKDRFGLSWQVVPRQLQHWMTGGSAAQADRVMATLLPMHKLEIAPLERAFAGG